MYVDLMYWTTTPSGTFGMLARLAGISIASRLYSWGFEFNIAPIIIGIRVIVMAIM